MHGHRVVASHDTGCGGGGIAGTALRALADLSLESPAVADMIVRAADEREHQDDAG